MFSCNPLITNNYLFWGFSCMVDEPRGHVKLCKLLKNDWTLRISIFLNGPKRCCSQIQPKALDRRNFQQQTFMSHLPIIVKYYDFHAKNSNTWFETKPPADRQYCIFKSSSAQPLQIQARTHLSLIIYYVKWTRNLSTAVIHRSLWGKNNPTHFMTKTQVVHKE